MIMWLFPRSPTTLIISLTHWLLWTKLMYVFDNMEGYKILPLIVALMVNTIPFSCPIHVTHMMYLYFWQHFLLFWIKSKTLRLKLCTPKSDLQYSAASFTPTLILKTLLKLENVAKMALFSNNHIYIDLIKTFLI